MSFEQHKIRKSLENSIISKILMEGIYRTICFFEWLEMVTLKFIKKKFGKKIFNFRLNREKENKIGFGLENFILIFYVFKIHSGMWNPLPS